jgi:hypothetical protein
VVTQADAADGDRQRRRPYRVVVSVLVGLEIAWIAYAILQSIGSPEFGLDYIWNMDAGHRLLDSGTPYWPWQIAGPYEIGNGAILYPPTAFALFIPFLWLPPALWWLIPIAITVFAMTRHRPPLWVWPVTVGLFCLEKSLNVYVFGNPTMWLVAAVAAGTVWYWPFALVAIKPTFAPIMLLGIRHRSWWIALVVLGVVSLPFGHLWLDWLAVVQNSNVSPAYNLPTLPLVVAPLLPWIADQRHPLRRVTVGRSAATQAPS